MKFINWLKNLFRRHSDDNQATVPPMKPVEIVVTETGTGDPEIKQSTYKLIEVVDSINNGNASAPDWTYLISTSMVDIYKKNAVKKVVEEQKAVWARYENVFSKTGVPARVIACLHFKESSLDFDRCLHNGDRVIGNGKKTWQVPKGRGPFATWEEAAIDALTMKKHIFPENWSTLNTLIFCQKYNGMGHQNKGLEYSPYIWAYTSHHDETGNYVADGKTPF
jgi:lysozyme family protein